MWSLQLSEINNIMYTVKTLYCICICFYAVIFKSQGKKLPLSFDTSFLENPCEYLHKPYITINYRPCWRFALPIVWVYIYSFSCNYFQK